MELETLKHIFPELSIFQVMTLWALILSLREIRGLYQTLIKDKERLCKAKDERNSLMQRELQAYQRKAENPYKQQQK